MHPNKTLFEKQEELREERERTPEEIAEQNQLYNEYLNGVFGVSEMPVYDGTAQEVVDGLSVDAKANLGVNSSGEAGALSEDVAEVYGALTQMHSADARTFEHSVDAATQEANEAMSHTSLGEADYIDVEKRVLSEKLENVADGEEVVGKPEFLNQESQNDVANVAIAEKMITAADEGDPEALANVQQLLAQSPAARAYFQNAKEAGGANYLDNETLAQLGRNIRQYDLAVPASEGDDAEAALETLDDLLRESEQNQQELSETNELDGEHFAIKNATNLAEATPDEHDLLTSQSSHANEKAAAINHARSDVFAAFDMVNQQPDEQNN